MASYREATPTLKRPNTVRFNIRNMKKVTPQDVYSAMEKDLRIVSTIKCIAELENGWYNVSFDNGKDCELFAANGIVLHEVIIPCKRVNVQNTAVV